MKKETFINFIISKVNKDKRELLNNIQHVADLACVSSEDVIAIMKEDMLERLADGPDHPLGPDYAKEMQELVDFIYNFQELTTP